MSVGGHRLKYKYRWRFSCFEVECWKAEDGRRSSRNNHNTWYWMNMNNHHVVDALLMNLICQQSCHFMHAVSAVHVLQRKNEMKKKGKKTENFPSSNRISFESQIVIVHNSMIILLFGQTEIVYTEMKDKW